MVASSQIKVDGDTATSRTMLFNPMVYQRKDGEKQVFFCGLWYRDQLVRTDKGWRIKDRYEQGCYTYNAPTDMEAAPDLPPAA